MTELSKKIIEEEALEAGYYAEPPDISHIVTEDDTPVDNMFSEKQQRLLAESLNAWKPGRPFIAAANVGIFNALHQPPIVPDMFLSLGVRPADDLWEKKNRSYFLWEFGKPPEAVVEIVSNKKGGETGKKFEKYAFVGVWYYIIFDPQKFVQKDALRIYELSLGEYIPKIGRYLEKIEIGVTLWEGVYEGVQEQWLRWCDREGVLVPTGYELAEAAERKAETEKEKAEAAEKKAETEKEKAEAAERKAEEEKKRAEAAEKRAEEATLGSRLEIARTMLANGMDHATVAKLTGLSESRVSELTDH